MKILHIITGLGVGGSERALYRLVTADTSNSHQIVVLTDFGLQAEHFGAAGIPVHRLGMPRGHLTMRGLMTLVRLLCGIRPDVVQTWMYHADLVGGLAARLSGFPVVVWGIRASDSHEHPSGASSRGLVWLCARLSGVVPVRIVFVSRAGAEVHARLGYRAAKSLVIPNGYDTRVLRPDPQAGQRQRAAWSVPSDTRVIGMVARWDPLKDHATLLAALRVLRARHEANWAAVLVGAEMTGDNEALVRMVDESGMPGVLRLLGPAADIHAAMNALDVHVLSSKSEAFPNVLAEAMACGTPCVTTDVGDAGVIVGATGWIVPPGDPDALAEALSAALAEMADRATWGRRRDACRARIVETFSLERMAADFNRLWQEAAHTHASR